MRKTGLRQTKRACLQQITAAQGLRDGAFDACTNSVRFFEGRGALPLSCRLQRQRERLGTKRQGAGSCLGTLLTTRAQQTISRRKLDVDDLVSKAIFGQRPRAALLSGRASDRLTLPIDLEMREIKALSSFRLPTVLQRHGTK